MAATLTSDQELTYVSFPIEKWDENADGSVTVYGKATDGSVDSDDQIVDSDWSAAALEEWFKSGPNLRVMHNAQRDPAGSGLKVEIDRDGDGAHWVKSIVDEPIARDLVRKGHLRAYSIGISRPYIERDVTGKASGGIIKGGELAELSLVDRPANRNCGISLLKAAKDGHAQWIGKAFGGDVLTKLTRTPAAFTADRADASVSLELPPDVSVSFSPGDLAKLLAHRRLAEKRQQDRGQDPDTGQEAPDLGKRKTDPDVGGGVDRDTIPAEDHVDPDGRRFPIVTPKDVADAVDSYGRAKPLIPMSRFRKRLTAIARRKGSAFLAQLPDSWQDAENKRAQARALKESLRDLIRAELTETDLNTGERTVTAGKTARPRQCADCNTFNKPDAASCTNCGHDLSEGRDHTHGDGDTAGKGMTVTCAGCTTQAPDGAKFCGWCGKALTPDTLKGGKDCPQCGKTYHADSKMRTCEGCGADLPSAEDTAKSSAPVSSAPAGKPGDGPDTDTGEDSGDTGEDADGDAPTGTDEADKNADTATAHKSEDTGDGEDDPDQDSQDGQDADGPDGDAGKAAKPKPPSDTADTDTDGDGDQDGAKGKIPPQFLKPKKGKKGKGKKNKAAAPVPTSGVTGQDSHPVPEHREPDGGAIEALEHDADIPTVPDIEVKNATALTTLGVDTDTAALHDLLCPALNPDAVRKAYPSRALTTLDVTPWMQRAMDAAATAPLNEAARAQKAWQDATTLKTTDPDILLDLRIEAYKAYQDGQAGPGTAPVPGTVTPGRFNRTYLTPGHARPSPGYRGPNDATVPSGQIAAADFTGGFQPTGRAADSPSNAHTPRPVTTPDSDGGGTGTPRRVYYSNMSRDNARQAMSAMHDHIANTFPDLCPSRGMAPGDTGGTPANIGAVPAAGGLGSKNITPAETVTVNPSENTLSDADVDALIQKLGRRLQTELPASAKTGKSKVRKNETPGADTAPGDHTPAPAQTTVPNEHRPAEPAALTPDLIKSALAEVTAPLTVELTALRGELAAERKRSKKLAQAVDALADMPDPRTAPWKGAAQPNALAKSLTPGGTPPVRGIAETAEQTQLMIMRELEQRFRASPDPVQREAAWSALIKMRGLAS